MISDRLTTAATLAQLRQMVGQSSASHVILTLLAVGLSLLVVDYARMILLRRKMVSVAS
jgi:hypothetical protein